jgi:YD repeat-containing protein
MPPIVARLIVSFMLLCGAFGAHAAQERYDYDALGRLVRVIDEHGRATEYTVSGACVTHVSNPAVRRPAE